MSQFIKQRQRPNQAHTKQERKPTLAVLQQWYHFDSAKLAHQSGVAPVVVKSMLQRQPIYPIQAHRILRALSQMYAMNFSMHNVEVVLYE